MTTKIYQEIDGSHTFVKKVIMEHYGHISSIDRENFDKIRVYNTVDNPLFNGSDVYYCLKKTQDNIKRMYGGLLDDEVLRQKKVNTQNSRINLITEYGVIHACYLYKNDIAIVFQKFMREVIKQLKNTGVATVIAAHNQLSKVLEEEQCKRRDAEIINKQNIFLQDAYCNDFVSNDDNETELTILRRQYLTTYYVYLVDWQYVNAKYWNTFPSSTKIPVRKPRKKTFEPTVATLFEGIELNSDSDDNCVNKSTNSTKKKRKKTKDDTTKPHKDGIQEPYEMKFIDLRDLESCENDEYYFYISAKETTKDHFKLIMPIQLDKSKHYTEMTRYITNGEKIIDRTAYPNNAYESIELKNNMFDDNSSTPVSKVYKTTYDTIKSARSRSYIAMNRELLLGMTNKKKTTPAHII
jgi:hypothetical protein